MSEVAGWSFLDRRSEDVAARAKEHPFAFRAERDVFNKAGDRDVARPSRQAVVRHGYGVCHIFFRPGVEDAKLAVELRHYTAVARGARPSDIPWFVRRDLCGPAAGYVICIKVEMAVAIGVEVGRIADPHWITARTRVVADLFCVEGFKIKDIKLIGLASPVALFRSEVARLR